MLTGLGKPAAPADAVDLLLECHGRIRSFLALALRLGGARGAGAADGQRVEEIRLRRTGTSGQTYP